MWKNRSCSKGIWFVSNESLPTSLILLLEHNTALCGKKKETNKQKTKPGSSSKGIWFLRGESLLNYKMQSGLPCSDAATLISAEGEADKAAGACRTSPPHSSRSQLPLKCLLRWSWRLQQGVTTLSFPSLCFLLQLRAVAKLIPAWFSQERDFRSSFVFGWVLLLRGTGWAVNPEKKKIQCKQIFDHSHGKKLDFKALPFPKLHQELLVWKIKGKQQPKGGAEVTEVTLEVPLSLPQGDSAASRDHTRVSNAAGSGHCSFPAPCSLPWPDSFPFPSPNACLQNSPRAKSSSGNNSSVLIPSAGGTRWFLRNWGTGISELWHYIFQYDVMIPKPNSTQTCRQQFPQLVTE